MCLKRIFEFLVELMHSHYLMREWHLKIERYVRSLVLNFSLVSS